LFDCYAKHEQGSISRDDNFVKDEPAKLTLDNARFYICSS